MISALQSQTDITQYESLLRPFAFNLTRNMQETEDLIQDTFCRALANQEKFSDGSNMKGWLFTIMRNIFINNYRRKQRGNYVMNEYKQDNIHRMERNGSERIFLAEDIDKAMQGMNEDFIRPFMMHYNGFQYNEIAEQFDLPLGTVKSRIFFARKELQAKLRSMGIRNSSNTN